MSQKTELQSNNTDLQAILATINALPEAGGGGGSVETCRVMFADFEIPEDALDSIIAYTDENSQVVSKAYREFDVHVLSASAYDVYGSVTVKVGTLFYINSWMDLVEGEGIVLDRSAFVINGDCSIYPY